MKSLRHVQRDALDSLRLENRDRGLNRLLGAGDHDILRPVDRGDRQFAKMSGDRFGSSRFVGKNGRHLAALRQRLHEPAPLGDELEPVFEAEDAGDASRGVFADAVTHDRRGLHTPRAPQLRERVFQRKQRRLREGRLVERRRFAGFRIQHGYKRSVEIRAEDFVTSINGTTKGWLRVVELTPHIDVLGPLSGKEKDHFGGFCSHRLGMENVGGVSGGKGA